MTAAATFLLEGRQDPILQPGRGVHLVGRPGERAHSLLERVQLPAARHAPAKVPANLRLGPVGERAEHVVGEVLAHVVTAHASSPATLGASATPS